MKLTPFHLAVPVHNLETGRKFYGEILGCAEGRSSDKWVDFNLFGHQFVIHLREGMGTDNHVNLMDGMGVPVPHFGVVLEWDQFDRLAEDMRKKGVQFVIEPYLRFKDLPGEQKTMFFLDPSGNALEFKAFMDRGQLFAR